MSMGRLLLLIGPVSADPDFSQKMMIVRHLCSARGLDCQLPSVNPLPFNLTAELSVIRNAYRILADLSYGRPSCYYELGLVEASQKQALLFARAGTEIFQHAGYRPVVFFDDLEGYATLVGSMLNGGSPDF